MQSSDIATRRLLAQHIATPSFEKPGDVVAWLGAAQAQDYLGALWAVGLRMRQATETAIEQAIAEKTIIRTWPMRGTLHFVATGDIRWMLKLMASRVMSSAAARHKQLELDDTTFARSRDIVVEALQGGKQLARPALLQVLEHAGISTAGQRGIHMLSFLAHEGLICFGAREGKQPTFVLLDEWVPPAKELERDEALAELARRYFTSHGPATVKDLVRWSGLTTRDVRSGIDMVGQELVSEEVDGQTYWMSPEAQAAGTVSPSLYLLPGFDEYVLGYGDRSAVLDPLHASKVVPGNNGMFMPTIISDGRVVGTWKRAVKKGGVVVTAYPFDTLTDAERVAFDQAADSYAAFLGMRLSEIDYA